LLLLLLLLPIMMMMMMMTLLLTTERFKSWTLLLKYKKSYTVCFRSIVILLLLKIELLEISSSNKNAAPEVKNFSVTCAFVRHIILSFKKSSNFYTVPKIAISKSNNKSFKVYVYRATRDHVRFNFVNHKIEIYKKPSWNAKRRRHWCKSR
jgi:hypothetical protein